MFVHVQNTLFHGYSPLAKLNQVKLSGTAEVMSSSYYSVLNTLYQEQKSIEYKPPLKLIELKTLQATQDPQANTNNSKTQYKLSQIHKDHFAIAF